VFRTVTNKEMEWSDRNVSGEDSAAGSMAKFSPLDVQISKSSSKEMMSVPAFIVISSPSAHVPPITPPAHSPKNAMQHLRSIEPNYGNSQSEPRRLSEI